jgi:hypothetical protein
MENSGYKNNYYDNNTMWKCSNKKVLILFSETMHVRTNYISSSSIISL